MKKYVLGLLISFVFYYSPVYCEDFESMTFDDFLKETQNNTSFRYQIINEKLQMFDINNDGKISCNEINKARESARDINIGFIKQDELKEELLATFQKNDKNNDNELSADEVKNFTSQMHNFLLKKSFMSLDVNNDGIYNEDDISSPKFMEQMDETIENMDVQDSIDYNQSMIKSLSAIADEDYYQMDKDHDNCVTENDYEAYKSQKYEDESLEQIYMDIDYSEIDKEKRDCLTKEEYIKQITMLFLEPEKRAKNHISSSYTKEYYQMDENKDSCVSRDEYIEYKQKEAEEFDTKRSYVDYMRMYIDIKKENKNCLTKEEYIADWDNLSATKVKTEINLEDEKEYAEALFEYMDKDSDGRLTAEEYAEHQYQEEVRLSAPNKPMLTKEDYHNNFLRIKATDKIWISKDEFVEYSVKLAECLTKNSGENPDRKISELILAQLYPGALQGVVSIPDKIKGEQLVLITDRENANMSEIRAYFKQEGLTELWMPKQVVFMAHPPVMGTGKFDYMTASKMLQENKE